MELMTKCYSCGGEIIFADGRNLVQCEYCGRTNARPKSPKNELDRMKYSNERLSFGEFDEAENGYREVLQRTPDEHEARWGLLLCKYGVRYVEDTKTGQRLPTCRRALPTSFCAEPDFRLACEAAPAEVRAEYERDGRYIDDIQREIRRLKVSGEQYDIFLCYKETDETGRRTRDSMLAQNLYQTLTLHGFSVFYAPISLKNSLGANYEAAIYVALETSKVMLVLATKPEYLETTWVRSEWTRYLERKDEGEEKLLIPLYRDFTPDRLPREFNDRFLQGLDMGNFTFIPDLESSLTRLLKEPEPEPEPTIVEDNGLVNLLKGGFMDLEDGDFAAAQKQFEAALSIDVESARANLGMAMVQLQARTETMLVEICVSRSDWAEEKYVRRTKRFADEHIKALLADIRSACAKAEAERKMLEDCEWRIDEDGVTITRYTGCAADAVIPRYVHGKQVTTIGTEAFSGCSSLTSVAIPESVMTIGDHAFYECGSLMSVTIPESVTTIGNWAFSGCSSLTSVTIPESVATIGNGAFYDCSSLTSVTIPESVQYIWPRTFEYCDNLKVMKIPESVAKVGWDWNLSTGHNFLTNAVIPDGVTMIADFAFLDCSNLTSVTIPESITTIGNSAFSGCSSLTSVIIPESVTTIENRAFSGCSSLTSVTIPESVTSIMYRAFHDCDELQINVDDRSPVIAQLKKEYGGRVVVFNEAERRAAEAAARKVSEANVSKQTPHKDLLRSIKRNAGEIQRVYHCNRCGYQQNVSADTEVFVCEMCGDVVRISPSTGQAEVDKCPNCYADIADIEPENGIILCPYCGRKYKKDVL